jgi:hypothetical protein
MLASSGRVAGLELIGAATRGAPGDLTEGPTAELDALIEEAGDLDEIAAFVDAF